MFKKLPLYTLVLSLTCVFTYAQDKAPELKGNETFRGYSLMFNGESFLGVQTLEITKENFGKFGLKEVRGVAIEKVIKDSPAEKAGLQKSDVIISFNGEPVTSTRKLTRLVEEVAPDHKAKITVLRNGSEQQLTATIGENNQPKFQTSGTTLGGLYGLPGIPEYPISPVDPRVRKFPAPSIDMPDVLKLSSGYSIGIGVESLTKQLGEYFGVENGTGVLINQVNENSPAAKAGLKAGDVIIGYDGQQVKNSFDLIQKINEKKEKTVDLVIVRNKNRQVISITPEQSKANTLTPEEFGKIESQIKTRFAPQTMPVPARVLPPVTKILK